MITAEKIAALNQIADEIRAFKGLDIAKNATKAVPGEGNPDAQIMFIGEAPGFNEDIQGRPFVGQAGKLLDTTLAEVGLNRPDVYITNIVKFRPPENRDPFPDEIEVCRGWLDRQIQIIEPQVIATLGRFSMGKFIPGITISKIHGQPHMIDFLNGRYTVFPMYHPAAALRAGEMMKQFKADFHKLADMLNITPSQPAMKPDLPSQASLF